MSSGRRSRLKQALGSRDEQIVAELRQLDSDIPVDPNATAAVAVHAKNLSRLYEEVAGEVKQAVGNDRDVERLLDALDQFAAGFRALARGLRATNAGALGRAEETMQNRFESGGRRLNAAVKSLGLER